MSGVKNKSVNSTLNSAAKTKKIKIGRREELIQTAVDFFSENGFQGTSVRDIANKLGVSISVIYHYFNNKEELWSAIIEYSVKHLPEKLELAVMGGGHALERLRRLLRAHLTASSNYSKETIIFLSKQDRISETGELASKEIEIKVLYIYVQILEELQREGLVKAHNTKILAFNILGVINWYLRWYRSDGPLTADALYEEIITFILYGSVGVPPGSEQISRLSNQQNT
ncbi:MAG: TetR/AcrR family transcriptional regulator [Desulfuromonadaceae bacterium]|nr:TetR/AcrR family transcriptional regulator [Desulfuromonadaceae bacterium]